MESIAIHKIYPSISELNIIKNNILCTEPGCGMVLKTQSNFTMHLQKHHKKQELEKKDCVRQFYCPDKSCPYSDKMHFTKIKYLKQHYLRVHAAKNHLCDKCMKGFPTENALIKHTEVCGFNFTCLDCTYSYGSYEALITHARRKKHNILTKNQLFQTQNECIPSKEQKKPAYILPKQSVQLILVSNNQNLIKVDKECQTEVIKNKTKSSPKKRTTQQTQTCSRKKSKISTETQTVGDCILKRAIQEAKIRMEVNNEQKKCIETQTKHNQNFTDVSVHLNFLDNENMMHSSCQTNLDNMNIFEDSSFGNCNSQTQTDLIFQDEFLQSTVFTSHIETQTNEDHTLDLSSNMYTQTHEDTLLSELEFTNIQTQTNWPDYDMFVSTETQTLLTHNTKSVLDMALLNGREISHMETQTDMEFKQLLEEINA